MTMKPSAPSVENTETTSSEPNINDVEPAAAAPKQGDETSTSIPAAPVIVDAKSLPAPDVGLEPVANPNQAGAQEIRATAIHPDRQFPLPKRFPLQVFMEETWGQRMSHWGPTITSLFSIGLAFVVWNSAQELSSKQVDLQERQLNLQAQQTLLLNHQVTSELADTRAKFLNDLMMTNDENKRTIAEIGLAGQGANALPVVFFALGVEKDEIRRSGVDVFYRMFQNESVEGRGSLLDQLIKQFEAPNRILHTGTVQALLEIGPLLNSTERQKIIAVLLQKFPPENVCSERDGRDLIREAATFVKASDPGALSLLLPIAAHPRCGGGWLQAMIKLSAVGATDTQKRAEVLTKIDQIRTQSLASLRTTTTDDDLISGGFDSFVEAGQVRVSFESFRRRVELEFDRLKVSLSSI